MRGEIEQLREENRILKLQLEEFCRTFLKKKRSYPNDDEDQKPSLPKKRGAPMGHPGHFRPRPDHIDHYVDVHLKKCPKCGGRDLKRCKRIEDHIQEDIELPKVKVTLFRHYSYYCRQCKEAVSGVGPGELPGGYIGPIAKSVAAILHYEMRVPYRKIQCLFKELFHLKFDPSSAPGFDRQIRIRGAPLYEELKKSLKSKPFVHADETGWRKEGVNHWLWCFGAPKAIVYHIDRSRGSKVVQGILGERYGGVLISDFLAAYNKLRSRKQRCLVHLLRLIKRWLIYFRDDRKRTRYFLQAKKLIQKIIEASNKFNQGRLPKCWIDKKADLIAQLRRILNQSLDHPKADKFLKKLLNQFKELVTCLDFKGVASHNNWAERLLRNNVIMRKVTFGNRSEKGARNHEVLMSLIQTAHSHNLNILAFLQSVLTQPQTAASSISVPCLSS